MMMMSQMNGKFAGSKVQSPKAAALIMAVRDKRIFSTGCSGTSEANQLPHSLFLNVYDFKAEIMKPNKPK